MKRMLISLTAVSVTSLTLVGCKGKSGRTQDSETKSWFGKTQLQPPELQRTTQQANEPFHFNLFEYLKTAESPLKAFVKADEPETVILQTFEAPEDFSAPEPEANTALGIGTKKLFRIENNLIVTQSPDRGSITGAYTIDAYALGRKIAPQSNAFNVISLVTSDPMAAKYEIRFLGMTTYRQKIGAEQDFAFTRNVTNEIDAPLYTLPGLGVSIRTAIGGEFGVKTSAGAAASEHMVAHIEPHASVNATLAGGVTALLFAKAESVGSVSLLKANVPSKIEFTKSSGRPLLVQFSLESFSVDVLIGKIDLVASIGIENALPAGVRAAWKRLATNVLGETYQYTFNVWTTKGLEAAEVPGFSQSW
ncbi:MAG: hypothetical protein H7249_04130 [Chitinophagaceae bacterium]|nr:hypothetical protein [Oligoflexus sp.]